MSTAVLTSKLTKRSQTTIPKAVKNALQVAAGDEIGYVIEGDSVRLVKIAATSAHADPALTRFLSLLEHDISCGNVHPLPPALVQSIRELTAGVPVDHDEEIDGAIAL